MNLDFVAIACPYCGESFEIAVEPGVDDDQHYVEDCAICCQPIRLIVAGGGAGRVRALRDDEVE